jgi:hypothetical protein
MVMGCELRASYLLGRCSALRPFVSVVLQIGCHIFAQAGLKLQSSYMCLLHIWNYRYIPPHLPVG